MLIIEIFSYFEFFFVRYCGSLDSNIGIVAVMKKVVKLMAANGWDALFYTVSQKNDNDVAHYNFNAH